MTNASVRQAIAREIRMWRRVGRKNPSIKYLCRQSISTLVMLVESAEFSK